MKKRSFFCYFVSKLQQLLPLLIIPVLLIPLGSAGAPTQTNDTASSVHTIIDGIISYTRWPQLRGLPRLCIFSSATWSRQLAQPQAQQVYAPVIVANSDQALNAQCDAVYFGTESVEQQIQLRDRYHGRPQLYIAEQNPDCSAGSAFCLNIAAGKVSFSVNLDSLSRGGVRVNPDVLMLARARKNNDE